MRRELIGHYSHNRIHGGVISASLDAMGGLAVMAAIGARHMDEAPAQRLHRFGKLGTIDLRIDYLRPGIGDRFELRAEVLRLGSRVATTRMEFLGAGRQAAVRRCGDLHRFDAFGDFDAKPGCGSRVGAQHGIGVGHELFVVDRGAGEIYRDKVRAGEPRQVGIQPFQHRGKHPAVDHADAAVGLGNRDHAARRHDSCRQVLGRAARPRN
jgi:acyl-coenzyme A thioesterase PaaI-like protein